MFRRFVSSFKGLRYLLPSFSLQLSVLAAMVALLTTSTAKAAPPNSSDSTLHFALGPSVSAIHRDSTWDSTLGAAAYLAWDRPMSLVSTLGASGGLSSFAGNDATRLSGDLYLGIPLLGGTIGIGVGTLIDFFPDHRPRYGIRGTIWLFAGITPYLSISTIKGLGAPTGPEFEAGLKIPFPAISW